MNPFHCFPQLAFPTPPPPPSTFFWEEQEEEAGKAVEVKHIRSKAREMRMKEFTDLPIQGKREETFFKNSKKTGTIFYLAEGLNLTCF